MHCSGYPHGINSSFPRPSFSAVGLTQMSDTDILTGVGIFHVNPRFEPTSARSNLGLITENSNPKFRSEEDPNTDMHSARNFPCYFHILFYKSGAKYENNMGKMCVAAC